MIETARLLLRPWRREDAPELQRLVSAREIAATTANIPHPYPPGGAAEYIAREQSHSDRFAIELRDDGSLVGSVALVRDDAHRSAEVGYWIAVEHWRRGYASEAVAAAVDFAFAERGLERLHAQALGSNPASCRVLEKTGFAHEGTQRSAFVKWGERHDLELYGLLREEWSGRRS
jgi:[ribosomal protein S5]-alanine N-acetyltransferase